MIKVGDKFKYQEQNWQVIRIDNDLVIVARNENDEEGIISQKAIYQAWCQQQKQRADSYEAKAHYFAEQRINDYKTVREISDENVQLKKRADKYKKRWNELKDRIIENHQSDDLITKQHNRSFLCLMDDIEGKENVFETVQKLEEQE